MLKWDRSWFLCGQGGCAGVEDILDKAQIMLIGRMGLGEGQWLVGTGMGTKRGHDHLCV